MTITHEDNTSVLIISSPLLTDVGDAAFSVSVTIQTFTDGEYPSATPTVLTSSDLNTDGNYEVTVSGDLHKITLSRTEIATSIVTKSEACYFLDTEWKCSEIDIACNDNMQALMLLNALRSVNFCAEDKCIQAGEIYTSLLTLTKDSDCC